MQIEFSGAELSDKDKESITNTIAGYARKNHTEIFHINIKSYDDEGKRAKYSVNLNVSTKFGRFTSEDVSWNLNKSVRESIRKVEKQVCHAMGRKA